LENLDLNDFDNIMNTNVRSIIVLTKLCLPYLIAQKGTIVNNSSINGTCSMSGVLAYSMSKSALDQFTKCLALGI
jgi:NAD(P)-dependent dehydrogenase (short-subunit alcohol dehydrogenase family)